MTRGVWASSQVVEADNVGHSSSEPNTTILKPRARGKHLDRPWHLTYLRNQGHGTPAQKAALRDLWQEYGVDVVTYRVADDDDLRSSEDSSEDVNPKNGPSKRRASPRRLNFQALFPSHPGDAPVALEIGFGLGDSLIAMARNNPHTRFLGVEVHKPGVGACLLKVKNADVNNVRLIKMDALWLLRDFVPENSLNDVMVYFPDPWSDSAKHRRIVNPFLLKLCQLKMKKGSGLTENTDEKHKPPRLHVSTDDESYAIHVEELFAEAVESGSWRTVPVDGNSPNYGLNIMPGRLQLSKYELKGSNEGRDARDFCIELKS
tara:strand:- start:3213 stop:4166 length:954 start_codon:yes stop_codon:yes gene_type:complete